eukprot:TRINITY_DN590_c0_g1_i2.p1 TRINITY_DN590_c0_g1~~TRINITY_DN590_c0_g1_i2.p1  ORF type:complete len:58 (+),score=2.36 TRINITY_DN590_c0_g1_i2:513-686(+)
MSIVVWLKRSVKMSHFGFKMGLNGTKVQTNPFFLKSVKFYHHCCGYFVSGLWVFFCL